MQVADVMHPGVVTIPLDLPVREIGQLMVSHRISGAPVVDGLNRPVGVVSISDLAAHAAGLQREREPRYLTDLSEPPHQETAYQQMLQLMGVPDDATAEQLMTTFMVRVEEHTPVTELVELILQTGIHRIFVTRDGRLTGVVTTKDLVRLLGKLLDRSDLPVSAIPPGP